MRTAELLQEMFGRVPQELREVLTGLSEQQLSARPDPAANTIGWLAWHLVRVQDDHLATAFDAEQVWTSGGWVERFGLPLEESDTGYGHSFEQVSTVRIASADLLVDYLDAVHARTLEHLRTLTADDLDRVVDEAYDPPVTLAVRLVSVLADDLQHVGQAAYLRGLLERAG